MGLEIGYYPGCSLYATFREGDESLRTIAPLLDVTLDEVDDWSCCGATSAHASNYLLSIALPARNLALAEAAGHQRLLAPCAACYNRLAVARHEMSSSAGLFDKVGQILERPFANSVTICNVVDFLHEMVPVIKQRVTRPLRGLKLACYYGCLLVRPAEVCSVDDTEAPTTMEEVVQATGAETVAWNMRLECCGAAFSVCRTPTVIRLGRKILADARKHGADAIVVACPMCHSNLDFRQDEMLGRGAPDIPIVFLAELVGLALDAEPRELGFRRHFIDARPFLRRVSELPVVGGP
jgi:heterodisulfide reductase subunit B